MAICILRTVILYLLLVVSMRLMGKKQVGELEPAELVLAMVLSDLASVPMQDFGIPLLYGVLPILIVVCLTMMVSVLTMKSVRFRGLVCGTPSVIVEDGVICQRAMAKNRFTADELMEELRLQGVTDLNTVRYAILENSGQVSVLLKADEQPPAARQLGLTPEESGLPVMLVSDGAVLEGNLRRRGLTRAWLNAQLAAWHVGVKDVYLLTMDQSGGLYFARKGEGS